MILAAGLSPAWQQILTFGEFRTGEVNRANEAVWCASGKVLNVSIALHHLKVNSKTLALIGGDAGKSIQDEFRASGIPARWVKSDAGTRVCTTILADNATTELVENARRPKPEALNRFHAAFQSEVKRADYVVLSGSVPSGTKDGYTANLLKGVKATSILDIRGPQLIRALRHQPLLVKPNREELEQTVGKKLRSSRQLIKASRSLIQQGAQWVLITSGASPMHLVSESEAFEISPLSSKVVNPIGCGDCLTAGIAAGLDSGLDILESVRLGVAAATVNLQALRPAEVSLSRARKLAKTVEIRSC